MNDIIKQMILTFIVLIVGSFTILSYANEWWLFSLIGMFLLIFLGYVDIYVEATADNTDFKTASPKLKHS